MARIRSTHPGQWTDEDFVECSAFCRLLVLALRNEADDCGIFEWKPTALKMRLMPADAVDVRELLQEAADKRQIRQFEVGGKLYGAVRNFCLWQRPKEPGQRYPLTAEMAAYVALTTEDYRSGKVKIVDEPGSGPQQGGSNGVAVPRDFPSASPKSPQREEDPGSLLEGAGAEQAVAAAPAVLAMALEEGAKLKLKAARLKPGAALKHVAGWLKQIEARHLGVLIEQAMSAEVEDPVRWLRRLVPECSAAIAKGEMPARLRGAPPEPVGRPPPKPLPLGSFFTRCATLGFGADRMGAIGWHQYEHIAAGASSMSDAELEAALTWCEVHGLTWRQGVMAEARVA